MAEQLAPDQSPSDLQQDFRQRSLRFVSDAAHDLIGPVNQVSSLVELFVRRYRGQLDDEAQNLLTHIQSAGARLAATAAGLGMYFNVAGAECRRTRVHIQTALEAALLTLEHEIQEAQAQVIIDELPNVEGDPDLMITLLRALLENSLKFRRRGVPARILVLAECFTDRCRISITDNGIGIEPQFREEVFLAFKKLNGHSYPGAGLGLTLARTIVEALGGGIRIADSGGEGTTVVFELPASTEPRA